jgi:AAA domain, putative AbiEii toxin, Type IV TA system
MTSSKNKEALRSLLESKKLEPYIRHIRFPQYKNLAADTRVDFTFPISALVGANGTNKSSILRALYGSPGHNNLGNFWFSTSTDPIAETGEGPSCFIYGHWNNETQQVVEVLKTRVSKEDDPDYWEPSRPIIRYGMGRMPHVAPGKQIPDGRSRTRWNAIDKNVVYLDFRAALSAFDKFFYHGELRTKPNTEKNRKDFVRTRAKPLKRALDAGLQSLEYRRSERLRGGINRALLPDELAEVGKILGRKYSEIKIIRHSLFNCDAFSCFMSTVGLKYTEAFAGSGEFAVVRIVTSIMEAPDQSLILLDEPEVSLHPGAQDRLLDFLTMTVKEHKHQIVISTHSPAIVRKLPPEAIKVLTLDSLSGKVRLPRQASLPDEAFFHLGEPMPGNIIVVVEDALAQALVKRALSGEGEAIAGLFDVQYFPGGSQTLWGHYLPIYAAEGRDNVFVLFDGDQRPTTNFQDPMTVAVANEATIRKDIISVTGVDIQFHADGNNAGANIEQQNAMRRKFVAWALQNVDYLPGSDSPEAFVWNEMEKSSNASTIEDAHAKKRFEKLTRIELGTPDFEAVTSDQIFATQHRCLATIPVHHVDLTALKNRLLEFAEKCGQNDKSI